MSHKHKFTNYAKPQQAAPVKPEVVNTPVVEEPVVNPEPPVVTPEPPVISEVKEVIGVVANCAKLNVREKATTNADIVCELTAGSEVMIDESKSTNDFYKICTASGVEGFCMKKFITVNS